MPKETVNPSLIDRRVVERNIKKGLLTRETYEKHLAALPDVAAQSEVIKARLGEEEEPEDLSDDEGEEESDTPEG